MDRLVRCGLHRLVHQQTCLLYLSFSLFLALEGRGTGQQKVGIGLFHRGTSAGRKMNGRRLAVFRVAYGCMDTPTDTTGPTLTCRFFRSRTDLSLASNSRSRWQSHEAEQAYLPTFFSDTYISYPVCTVQCRSWCCLRC